MVITPRIKPGPTDRRESALALVEYSWAEVDTPRPVARPHVVLLVVALAAAGALGTGVVLQLVSPVPLPKPASAPPATVASYTAVSGWDCAVTGDHGFDAHGRTAAWYTVANGGWTQDSCHGTFEAIPMTGDKGKDDPAQYAVWWFTPGSTMTRCAVLVYRPAPEKQSDAAAGAAQYWVLAGRNGSRLAGFTADQTTAPGSWAVAGTFPVSAGGIAVELVDRGVPSIPTSRLAVSQVQVRCTA